MSVFSIFGFGFSFWLQEVRCSARCSVLWPHRTEKPKQPNSATPARECARAESPPWHVRPTSTPPLSPAHTKQSCPNNLQPTGLTSPQALLSPTPTPPAATTPQKTGNPNPSRRPCKAQRFRDHASVSRSGDASKRGQRREQASVAVRAGWQEWHAHGGGVRRLRGVSGLQQDHARGLRAQDQ